ncbi:hypothetical protein [Streptomyces sp. NBC_00878]|uniref:hypothetical protein n=1 Tax=Streptomyces sp. NBC_00878 TaxID=2975854 RepID=UPI0022570CA2|nr:hypothetical protein [Streptomyces sp. NBC_00878]MCX4902936.1 hypothetical protein [Streptomyces sp. NBC_00878]
MGVLITVQVAYSAAGPALLAMSLRNVQQYAKRVALPELAVPAPADSDSGSSHALS